jgi:L-rhamnose mutarotase
MENRRFCFACDLVNEPALIAEYKAYHAQGKAWPQVTENIRAAGIVDMEIYILGNRLFMVMEVDETYTAERKERLDAANPKVQEWEKLMWKFQQHTPNAKNGEKWSPMERIFKLDGEN